MSIRSLAGIGLLVMVLSACGPGGLKQTSTAPAGVDPTSTSLPQGDAVPCLPGLPMPPAAMSDEAATTDYLNTIATLGGKVGWFDPGAEFRAYTVLMAPDDVETFFEDAMQAQGWEQIGHKSGKNWGFFSWQKDLQRVQFLTGEASMGALFILACSTQPPEPTAIAIQTLDYKAAFEFLRSLTGYSDMEFYSYASYATDAQALSSNYLVSGYSVNAEKFCYITSDPGQGAVELTCRDQADAPTDPMVGDLSVLKDGIDLVDEAFAMNKPCAEPFNFAINLTQRNAQFLCDAVWSQDIDVYK